jgi:hypothetical protein
MTPLCQIIAASARILLISVGNAITSGATKTEDHMTYHEALKALNEAAYTAMKLGKQTADKDALRQVARATDALVDGFQP